jgi:hypothetical protein
LIQRKQTQPNQQLTNFCKFFIAPLSIHKPAAVFFVVRQKRRFRSPAYNLEQGWVPVSLFDSENHYHSPAFFDTREEAEAYMETYSRKLIQKDLVNLNIAKNQKYVRYHSEVPSLKIFVEDKIPVVGLPSSAAKLEQIQEEHKEQEELMSIAAAAIGGGIE